MLAIKNLKKLIKNLPDDMYIQAYEGEGSGLRVFEDDEKDDGKYGWIETGYSSTEECNPKKHDLKDCIKIKPKPKPKPIKFRGRLVQTVGQIKECGFTREGFTDFLIKKKVLPDNEIVIRWDINNHGFFSFSVCKKRYLE